MGDDAPILQGLKVLDVASFIAGPAATTVMADHGADVIKIEAPGGDGYRRITNSPGMPKARVAYHWMVDNRTKRGLQLDLRQAPARQVMVKLLACADVLVTNFVPRRDRLTRGGSIEQYKHPCLINDLNFIKNLHEILAQGEHALSAGNLRP